MTMITKKTLKIKVTQEDIWSGKALNPCQCPIALAAIRETDDKFYVRSYTMENLRTGVKYTLSAQARRFLGAFDRFDPKGCVGYNNVVYPFQFEAEEL